MLTPAAKRRRAESASATLSRPFRSPAVRGTTGGTTTGTAPKSSQPSGHTTEETLVESPRRSSKRPRPSDQSSAPQSIPLEPVSLDSLISQFSRELDAGDALLAQVHAGDAATAAKTNTKKDMYDELPALIVTWREAGRLAAEQVYEFVSQRIAGAGGIKAWRAMAAPPPADDDGDDGSDERNDNDDDEGEASRRERVQAEEEVREAHERADAEQSQNFTMAMMLASLNVEPDLLGYDEDEERWAD